MKNFTFIIIGIYFFLGSATLSAQQTNWQQINSSIKERSALENDSNLKGVFFTEVPVKTLNSTSIKTGNSEKIYNINSSSCSQNQPSNNYEGAYIITDGNSQTIADNFIVNGSTSSFELEKITANLWIDDGILNFDGTITEVKTSFYTNNYGKPGVLIGSSITFTTNNGLSTTRLVDSNGLDAVEVVLTLPNSITFNGSTDGSDVTYWIQLEAKGTALLSIPEVYWEFTSNGSYGYPLAMGQTNGNNVQWSQGPSNQNTVFKIEGNCTYLSCPEPINLSASTSGNSVTLNWDETGTATNWIVEYGPKGFIPGNGTLVYDSNTPGITVTLSGGKSYDFYVKADCGTTESYFAGPKNFDIPPTNNNFDNPIVLTLDGSCIMYSNIGADVETNEPIPNCWISLETTVWFTFTAPASGKVRLSTDYSGATLTNTQLAVYEATGNPATFNNLNEISCDEDSGIIVSNNSTLTADNLNPGETYYVHVDGYAGQTGNFCLITEIIPNIPINDDLENAIALEMNVGCTGDAYTNVGATTETGEPKGTCWWNGDNSQKTVWFSFVAPTNGKVNISTDISPANINDSQITVYSSNNTPPTMNSLTQVGCDEDGGNTNNLMSKLDLTGLNSGNTYYIQVDGYNGDEGSFCITITNPDNPYEYIYSNNQWNPSDPSGVSTSQDDIIVMNGTTKISADTDMKTLTINSGATLNIEQAITMTGNIFNNGQLIFVCDFSQTKLGQLAAFPSNASITGSGSITTQTCIPGRRSFRLLSSAITTTNSIHSNWQEGATSYLNNPSPTFGTHITGVLSNNDQWNGFDLTGSGNPSLFLFNNANQEWNSIDNTNSNSLQAGKAYRLMIRGDRSISMATNGPNPTNTILRATGPSANLALGSILFSNLNGGSNAFNFIGNPYPAIVDLGSVLNGSVNLNTTYVYVWNPNLGGIPTIGEQGGRGAYVTVNVNNGVTTPTNSASKFLMPGQSFFVLGSGGGNASLTFEESDKAVDQSIYDIFKEEVNIANINLQLYSTPSLIAGNTMSDGVQLFFSPNGDNTVLPNDAPKLGNLDENLCRVNGNHYLSMENRALPQDDEILPLFINQYRHSNYTYQAEVSGFDANVTAYLKDAYLDVQTELPTGTTLIEFSVDESIPASIAADRFSIVFGVNNLSTAENNPSTISIYPNPTKGNFFVDLPLTSTGKTQLTLYNILGEKVFTLNNDLDVNRLHVKTNDLAPGVYLVEISNNGKTYTKKLILQ